MNRAAVGGEVDRCFLAPATVALHLDRRASCRAAVKARRAVSIGLEVGVLRLRTLTPRAEPMVAGVYEGAAYHVKATEQVGWHFALLATLATL